MHALGGAPSRPSTPAESERLLEQLVGVERRRPVELWVADQGERLLDADASERPGPERLLDLPPGLALLRAGDVGVLVGHLLAQQQRPVSLQAELTEPVE